MTRYSDRTKRRLGNGQKAHHGDLRAWICQIPTSRTCQLCEGPIRVGDVYVERLVEGTRLWAPVHKHCL